MSLEMCFLEVVASLKKSCGLAALAIELGWNELRPENAKPFQITSHLLTYAYANLSSLVEHHHYVLHQASQTWVRTSESIPDLMKSWNARGVITVRGISRT